MMQKVHRRAETLALARVPRVSDCEGMTQAQPFSTGQFSVRSAALASRRTLGALAVALAALCGTPAALLPCASAQVAPLAGSSSDGRMEATYVGGRFTLTDTILHRPIFQSISNRLFMDQQVTPSVRFVAKPGGADFVYTYTNNTDRPLRLGKVSIPGMRMPGDMEVFRFRQDVFTQQLSNFGFVEAIYPNGTYSPIQIFQDDRHIVGVSLLYNAVEYNHPVQIATVSPGRFPGDNGQHWNVDFRFTHDYFVATIPVGKTRTYTVAVRAVPRDQSWLKTIMPYRDYFRSLYGPVDYIRDPRPIVGEAVSFSGTASDSNPRGFAQTQLRPDVHGWGAWATRLRSYSTQYSTQRVMLWAPSGNFRVHSTLNFPFQFLTGMNSIPRMRDSFSQLASVPSAGINMGFWWGRSQNIMRGWDQGAVGSENFNMTNPEHRALAFAELDMATSVGATMIGLDAYVPRDPGDGYNWLRAMKERAPNVKFITENAASDLIHNLTPTFHEASEIRASHVLADFLNPGHETWAAIQGMRGPGGAVITNPTISQRQAEMRRLCELGFVPLIYGPVPLPSGMLAQDSSRFTIPRELQAMMSAPTAVSSRGMLGATRERRLSGQRIVEVVPP